MSRTQLAKILVAGVQRGFAARHCSSCAGWRQLGSVQSARNSTANAVRPAPGESSYNAVNAGRQPALHAMCKGCSVPFLDHHKDPEKFVSLIPAGAGAAAGITGWLSSGSHAAPAYGCCRGGAITAEAPAGSNQRRPAAYFSPWKCGRCCTRRPQRHGRHALLLLTGLPFSTNATCTGLCNCQKCTSHPPNANSQTAWHIVRQVPGTLCSCSRQSCHLCCST